MTAIFITATGTDIGKTFVAAGLIRSLRAAGRAVNAFKPVVSGFDPANAAASDPGVLLAALGRPLSEEEIARIAPWRFRAPLSPHLAAAREGTTIDFEAVLGFCRAAAARPTGTLLIEGIGGVMVPLDTHRTVLDLMAALQWPVLLVAGSYLGSISHTLTALQVLADSRLRTIAIVVSESKDSGVALADTVATLARFAAPVPIVAIPRAAVDDHAAFAQLAALISRPPPP